MARQKNTRNPADFPILGVLIGGPSHGYEICPELSERLGYIWALRKSHIYALLAGLEKDGLVRHQRVNQETRPAKKIYTITQRGREVFLQWLRSPVKNMRDIRLEFLAKLHFARRCLPAEVERLVSDQLLVCLEGAERLNDEIRFCSHPTEHAALNYRLAMVNAIQAWLTGILEAQRRETRSTIEGSRTWDGAEGRPVFLPTANDTEAGN